MNDERPISFVGVTASDSETTETHEFDQGGTITGADVYTHAGQEYALRQYAEIIREGSPTSLWEALNEDYLAGDGEDYDLPLRFEFEEGDVLRLRAENINTSGNDYHHNMSIHVDYEESLSARIGAALRGTL